MNQSLDKIFLHKIYAKLIECAMNGEPINSMTLAEDIGMPKGPASRTQAIMNSYLTHITSFEHIHKRPMLTSMIVQKSSKPTKAWLKTYYNLYEDLKIEDAEIQSKLLLSAEYSTSCKNLLELQQQKVIEYWTIPQLLPINL